MESDHPTSLADLLRSGEIKKLWAQAERRARFTAEIKALLPAEEAHHLVSAKTDDRGRLILAMDSAAWAARVRFRTQEFAGQQLRVKVIPKDGE